MKLEWAETESDYGLEEAAFYEGPPVPAPPPTKHVSFSLRLDLCDEGGGVADGIKTEPPEAEEPRTMQKVPSLSDLSDPEASLGSLQPNQFKYAKAQTKELVHGRAIPMRMGTPRIESTS
ncbi:unnamed protein product [Arctia plantaginis]|uniref:Uncharacterized protein n=1 Tax=Arctia plantaginis TaxID=874455 RepID=A0A8S1AKL4_ARCPL|nr:unnamed protein product [Arctia plantaginis]